MSVRAGIFWYGRFEALGRKRMADHPQTSIEDTDRVASAGRRAAELLGDPFSGRQFLADSRALTEPPDRSSYRKGRPSRFISIKFRVGACPGRLVCAQDRSTRPPILLGPWRPKGEET